jgi:hypothetical protein
MIVRSAPVYPSGMISPLLIQHFTPIRPNVVRASWKP